MAVDFYLKNPESGSKNTIFLRLRVRKQNLSADFKLKTGLSTSISSQEEWANTISITKKRNRYKSTIEGQEVEPKLEKISITLTALVDAALATGRTLTSDDIREAVNSVVNEKAIEDDRKRKEQEEEKRRVQQERERKKIEEERRSLHRYFTSYLEKKQTEKRQHTLRNTRQALVALEHYEQDVVGRELSFDDMDMSFYDGFISYLSDKGYRANTVGSHIKNLKAVLHSARIEGFHDSRTYEEWRKPQSDIDAVALTSDELDALKKLDLSQMHPSYQKVRDLFLIGVYSCQRVSDFNDASKMNAVTPYLDSKGNQRHYLALTQKKTDAKVIIPLTRDMEEIYQRYDFSLPYVPEQKINKYIKVLCQMAGINEKITIVHKIGAGTKETKETKEKWELVSSHTARRTGCTLLYLSAKDGKIREDDIRELSGHKSTTMLKKYIKANELDKVLKLSTNPIFD